MLQNSSDLYNGNIARMVTTITDPNSRAVLPLGNAYRYDQLNRLKHAVSFDQLNGNAWAGGAPAKYENSFTYDANGNILTQTRKDDNNQVIDELAYFYPQNAANKTVRNRLLYVSDNVDYDASDINPGMSTSNYAYDQEGRLIQDLQEQIASIEWRVDGKVKRINRIANSTKQNLSFDYENQRKLMKEERFAGKQNSAGEMGHRIAKHVYTSANVLEKSTYYVLDATGNTMATYERAVDENTLQISYAQTEKFIYGSARLGVQNVNIGLLGSQNNTYTQTTVPHRIGKKGYELSNHLGNVLSVISDKAIPHNNGGGVVDYFLADIRQAQDFSPFGVLLQNRNLSLSGANPYRYSFNGMSKDDELKGEGNSYDFGARMLDPRLGRWFRIDPLAAKYSTFSPYVFVGNMPIIAIDPNGMEIIIKAKDGATIKYVPGMEVPKNITNQLQDVIMGLNHMYINVPSAQVKLDFLVNLENQGLIINIVSNFGAVNKFYPPNDNDPLHGEIFFNPNQADVLLNGGLQSPIVALAHELQHGYNYYDAYQAYDNAESEKDYEFADVKIAEYNNMEYEENRTTTTGLEPETAKTYNNSTREKYNAPASIYYVGCITCTSELVPPTEIAIVQIETTNKILEIENKEKVSILIQESQPTH